MMDVFWHNFNCVSCSGSKSCCTHPPLSRKGASLKPSFSLLGLRPDSRKEHRGLRQLTQLSIMRQTQRSNRKQAVRQSLLSNRAVKLSTSIVCLLGVWHDRPSLTSTVLPELQQYVLCNVINYEPSNSSNKKKYFFSFGAYFWTWGMIDKFMA